MAEGGYEPVPHEDPDEMDPTESESRRTDEGDWTPGRRPREHRSSSRHQYETKKGSSSGVVNPSYEEGDHEEVPSPPTNTREVWVRIKDGKKNVMVDVGEEVQEECRSLVDGIYKKPDYTKLMFERWKMGGRLLS